MAMASVPRLFLARHGATGFTSEDRFSGAEGAELSDEGRSQAADLGDRLRPEAIHVIYSSPLSRAMETAALIASRCAATLETRERMSEISHRHSEWLTRAEVERRFPEEYAACEADPFTFASYHPETRAVVL